MLRPGSLLIPVLIEGSLCRLVSQLCDVHSRSGLCRSLFPRLFSVELTFGETAQSLVGKPLNVDFQSRFRFLNVCLSCPAVLNLSHLPLTYLQGDGWKDALM